MKNKTVRYIIVKKASKEDCLARLNCVCATYHELAKTADQVTLPMY